MHTSTYLTIWLNFDNLIDIWLWEYDNQLKREYILHVMLKYQNFVM